MTVALYTIIISKNPLKDISILGRAILIIFLCDRFRFALVFFLLTYFSNQIIIRCMTN